MKRSTVIATCLVNSNMVTRIDDAERSVHQIFLDEHPGKRFDDWNGELEDAVARRIIRTVGRASTINVAKFITDLAAEPI
jgi:hypothetical protein